MFIILIPVFFILLWIAIFNRQPQAGLRESLLKTTLLFFAFVAAATEILSLFSLINKYSLILIWSVVNLALFIDVRRTIKTSAIGMWKDWREKIGAVSKFYPALLILIYAVILILALLSPPNSFDSMVYHMARVAHWIQSGSVGFYPTSIIRQLYQPPLAEYSILHLQILSGGDYFSNLVQWVSLVSCGAVVSLIAKRFGLDLKMQTFAAFLSATLPSAIVQGSGTQNDLVVSLFAIAFFYFWMCAVKSNSWTDFFWIGLALALALLTKGTSYLYCLPIGVYFVGVHFFTLKKPARWLFVKQTAVVLMIAIAFNIGHYARNYDLFGAPVSTGNEEVRNKNLTPKMVFSNLARNYAINLGTYSEGLRLNLEDLMRAAFGDELKNPDSTWLSNEFRITYSTHEDSTGNFIHILLITLALLLVFLIRKDEKTFVYGAVFSILGGFFLLSLLLKWQIYGSRLQMPFFFLGCAVVALVIARFPSRIITAIAILSFLFSLSAIFFAAPRDVFTDDFKFDLLKQTRRQKFYANFPTEDLYVEALGYLKQQPEASETVGLLVNWNDYEYPLWFLLKDDFRQKPYIYHVGVENGSSKFVRTRPLPVFIISLRSETTIEGVEYKEVWKKNYISILKKSE